MKKALEMERFSLKCEGSLGRAPSLGTLEDMFRNASDTSISLHRGHYTSERNWNQEGGPYTGEFE